STFKAEQSLRSPTRLDRRNDSKWGRRSTEKRPNLAQKLSEIDVSLTRLDLSRTFQNPGRLLGDRRRIQSGYLGRQLLRPAPRPRWPPRSRPLAEPRPVTAPCKGSSKDRWT